MAHVFPFTEGGESWSQFVRVSNFVAADSLKSSVAYPSRFLWPQHATPSCCWDWVNSSWKPKRGSPQGWGLVMVKRVKKKNSMVWVRERTIPTEWPRSCRRRDCELLRIEGATWSAGRIPTAVFSVFWTGAATFLQSSCSVVLTRLSWPRSRPTTFFFW
jgi:hypothetical protein